MEKNESPSDKLENAQIEEGVLKFWQDNKIFEKSLKKDSPKGEFVFFEGPPTANAKPALHHLEARAFKDVIPRYKTMQGFHVRRRGGWDTHGLPVELQIEKKLGLKSKKEIEEYGIEKFNKECKESVFQYIKDWEDFTDRIGYWVDKRDAYFTFDTNYIESLWNIFAEIEKKNLLYKDYRIVPWCARCGTSLSSHELAQGYEDVKDLSVFVKFRLSSQVDVQNSSESPVYFLAWTTTPWTLPGNMALAVGNDIDYVEVEMSDENYILAKDRLDILKEEYKIIKEIKGKDLVGLSYEPLYAFLKTNENSHKVYAGDFVNTEDGTGIVHIAPMYGVDDFELGTKAGLPKEHIADAEGKFVAGTDFLEGRFVMEKDEAGKPTVAVDIINDLTGRGLFFSKKNYEHNYPHCWRCKTPLLYYARDSWYVEMSKLRNDLISENQKINWEPAHIKDGRFGEWIKEVKDWAISRERYWGTPMPVWENDKKDRLVIGSIGELKKYSKTPITKIIFVRHGQAESNVLLLSSSARDKYPLTKLGQEQAEKTAEKLMKENVDIVLSSPVLRAKQTAEAFTKKSGMEMIIDDRLSEIESGCWEGKSQNDPTIKTLRDEYKALPLDQRFLAKRGEFGESWEDLEVRVKDFLDDILNKYQGKTILCFSHQGTNEIALKILKELTNEYAAEHLFYSIENGDILPLYIDSRTNKEIDLHRPLIDGVVLEKDGKEFHRVKEVLDVWFDSGSMPFAQDHYPFENKEFIDGPGYPADFISEAVDQTRGWFYTLLAVGVLMGKGTPYKNAICLGHILDDKGKKMSKSIGNIVNPWEMMDKYGVDTLRLWMYSVNQPGDSKNFDEKTVAELNNKVFTLVSNCYKFYELYSNDLEDEFDAKKSENILDKWILSKLYQLIKEGTENLDNYKILEPVRALRDFIGDLSTWYIRRSRDRFKGDDEKDKQFALATTKHVFTELAKFMAPMAPFFAEDLYKKVGGEKESVHLDSWPEIKTIDEEVLKFMKTARETVTLGLEARQKANIKVRQPLKSFVINQELPKEFLELVKDELNVKEINYGEEIKLDTEITPELQKEGDFREFLRNVQGLRKEANLLPDDLVNLFVPPADKDILSGFEDELKKVAGIKEVKFEGEKIRIEK